MTSQPIQEGDRAFLMEGADSIGVVRRVTPGAIFLFVENAGDFEVPRSAVVSAHDSKVMLRASGLQKDLLSALGHVHDREDPNLVG